MTLLLIFIRDFCLTLCMATEQWVSGFVWHQNIMVTKYKLRAMSFIFTLHNLISLNSYCHIHKYLIFILIVTMGSSSLLHSIVVYLIPNTLTTTLSLCFPWPNNHNNHNNHMNITLLYAQIDKYIIIGR